MSPHTFLFASPSQTTLSHIYLYLTNYYTTTITHPRRYVTRNSPGRLPFHLGVVSCFLHYPPTPLGLKPHSWFVWFSSILVCLGDLFLDIFTCCVPCVFCFPLLPTLHDHPIHACAPFCLEPASFYSFAVCLLDNTGPINRLLVPHRRTGEMTRRFVPAPLSRGGDTALLGS